MLTLYKIYKEGDNNFYIGSTNDFSNRKRQHKNGCKTREQKLYNYIRENGGWDNWKIEKIGECGSVNGEIKYIKEKKPSLNTYLYGYDMKKSSREWKVDNREYNNKYLKRYYHYRTSWGGDVRRNNNLLSINPNLFN